MKAVRILGIRGVPAQHGGFETFAERLSLHLQRRGWRVTVYCQGLGRTQMRVDEWRGIERIHIGVDGDGPRATMAFDWHAVRHAARSAELCLTLGYNTAVFCALLRARGIPNIINMDGIEWSRAKWGLLAKSWLWANEWAGCWLGNQLVADHPAIAKHLASRGAGDRSVVIPYGADELTHEPSEPVRALGLEPGRYLTLIARPEPENSVLEAVRGFSLRRRGLRLAVLGNYSDTHRYQRSVKEAAGDEVSFLGAIYEPAVVRALRFHSAAYVHGHQVGGTNPSLVEAMGAGNPVIAHDNRFNRWVAGDGAMYFYDASSFATVLDKVLTDPALAERLRASARSRFASTFTWDGVLRDYEALLTRCLPSAG